MNEWEVKRYLSGGKTEFPDVDFQLTTYYIMGQIGGMNCHNFIEIIYVNEGEVEYTIDGTAYMVECGGLLLIKPGERYFVESMSQKLVRTSLKISPERIIGLTFSFKDFKKTVARMLDDKDFKRIYTESELQNSNFVQMISECNREWKDRTEGFEYIIKANIIKMIVWMLRNDIYEIRSDIGANGKVALI